MPAHIDISNHYLHDTVDHLDRFDLTWDRFATTNWRRVKACLDLRMACECILKSVVAYFSSPQDDHETILRRVTRLGHDIDALHSEASTHLTTLGVDLGNCNEALAKMPVDVRYRVDSSLLKSIAEDFYYSTIGSDIWVNDARKSIGTMRNAMDDKLQIHSQIVHVSEIVPDPQSITKKQAWWLQSCIKLKRDQ